MNNTAPAPIEQTLCLLKPDSIAANHSGAILTRFEIQGLQIIAALMLQLSLREAASFYAIHAQQPFFQELVTFICSGPILAFVLQGPDAVQKTRHIIGNTHPQQAAPGTIRADFGTSTEQNAIHASDSLENAHNEIAFFFPPNHLFPRH